MNGVQVSVSFNAGQQWISSSTNYTYICNKESEYIDPTGSGSCLQCPDGGTCDGGPNYYPNEKFWRPPGRSLNSKIYEVRAPAMCPTKRFADGSARSKILAWVVGTLPRVESATLLLCVVTRHPLLLWREKCVSCSRL